MCDRDSFHCELIEQVPRAQILLDLGQTETSSLLTIHDDPYSATKSTHAIVICTEWDEFVVNV